MRFDPYDTGSFYDEMFESGGQPRAGAAMLVQKIEALSLHEIKKCQQAAELALLNMGITFNVYGHEAGTEKVWPFDIVPRIIEAHEWERIEKGLRQRITALNLFIDDVYHDQKIVKDGIVPEELLHSGKCYLAPCAGLNPPRGVWCHISGIDLVRNTDGSFYVLEDNMRCPSGVSYVLENREVMKRTFPQVFEGLCVRPVDDYPDRLLETLQYVAPEGVQNPVVALLTPGVYNSAYFEHSFLAQQMGIELVTGSDLVVSEGYVLHAHHQRSASRGRDLSPHRRRFPRPARATLRFAAGRAGLARCLSQWACGAGQRSWHRHRGRQGRVRLRAADHPLLPGRGRSIVECADVRLLGRQASRPRASEPRQVRGKRSEWLGWIRHADGSHGLEERA